MAARSQKAGAQTVLAPQLDQALAKRTLLHNRPQWLVGLAENLLILTFIVLGIVGMLHHELWRDETQSWLLARDSSSVIELFGNAHYEGHPLLWHYCLYLLSRISRNLMTMQVFSLLLATGSVWLIVKRSPFSLLQRGLLAFGYFTLYEYALLSRSYGLGVFLAFLFCALYCQQKLSFWALTAVLALLANTSILGLVMSGALAIALYYRLTLSPSRKTLSTHFFVLLAAWGLSAFQIGRSLLNPMGIAGFDADARAAAQSTAIATIEPATHAAILVENFDKLFQVILKSYLPLPTFTFHFWNDHLLQVQALPSAIRLPGLILSGLLTGIILSVAFQRLKQTPLFLSIYGLGSLGMMGLFALVYRGSTRHYGHLFILFLVCLWLAKWSRRYLDRRRSLAPTFYSSIFTIILCAHTFSGLYAYCSDLLFPFSASYQAAQILQLNQLDRLPLLGLSQRPVSSLSAYLDRPFYYPESRQLGSFWDISYPEMTDEGQIVAAIESFAEQNPMFVAVLTSPLLIENLENKQDTSVRYLAYVGPSIVEDEAYYLYQVEQLP